MPLAKKTVAPVVTPQAMAAYRSGTSLAARAVGGINNQVATPSKAYEAGAARRALPRCLMGGTTAMRDVPRGTHIVICGAAGCLETVVSDYGPSKAGGRLIEVPDDLLDTVGELRGSQVDLKVFGAGGL